jgi:hypothetical protein
MAPSANNSDVLDRIEVKLDHLLRLTALRTTQGMKQTAAIQLLAAAGFDRRLIAELLNTTPNTVSVTLSTSRAKAKRGTTVPEGQVEESA